MEQDDYRDRLVHDLAAWRRDGLIEASQERAILARVGAGTPGLARALRLGWLVTAISIVGALVLGAGVILLFAANWDEMPDGFRTGLALSAMLGAYAIGYALIYQFDMQRVGSAFLLLGAVLYEAGIFLIAQIYNMPVNSPILWLVAALGVLPLAYLFQSRIVLILAIANVGAWIIAEMAQADSRSDDPISGALAFGIAAVAVYAIGRLHTLHKSTAYFSDVYVFAGLLSVFGIVYFGTFVEIWDDMIEIDHFESYAAPTVVYVAVVLAAAIVVAQWLGRASSLEQHLDSAAQAALLATAAVVATWPDWTGYAIVFNGIFFALAAASVARGYLSGDARYVNLGLAAIGIGVFSRYIDVFWSQLANSAFFIAGGILLLAVAIVIERIRRDMLESMDNDDPAIAPPALPPSEASA